MPEQPPTDTSYWGTSGSGESEVQVEPAFRSDQFLYRVVLISLGLALIGSMVGAVWLALCEKENDALLAIGSATVGPPAGVLAGRR